MMPLEKIFDDAFPNMSKEFKSLIFPMFVAYVIARTFYDMSDEVAIDDRGNVRLG